MPEYLSAARLEGVRKHAEASRHGTSTTIGSEALTLLLDEVDALRAEVPFLKRGARLLDSEAQRVGGQFGRSIDAGALTRLSATLRRLAGDA